jgi:hypothetical protein
MMDGKGADYGFDEEKSRADRCVPDCEVEIGKN